MNAELNETIQEDSGPILQLNRPLLQIDKYAAREGLSLSIVEECGRLGILQIRKYKGKTYVVDIPLSPYLPACEDFSLLQEQTYAETLDPIQSCGSGHPVDKAAETKKIAELAQRIASDANETTDELPKADIEPFSAETMFTSATKMPCQATQIHETDIPENKLEPAQIPLSSQTRFKSSIEQIKVKRVRQVITFSLIVCIFAAFLAGSRLYMNQSINRSKLDRTSANVQAIYDDSVRTSQYLATFQNNLVEFTAELELAKNELNNTKTEVTNLREELKRLQNELTQMKKDLETIQQHNTTTLEQLREQLRQLTDKIDKIINKKILSGSSTPN